MNKKDFWLLIDKPNGISSAKAVAIVKKLCKATKAGHAGTLDPVATGVLPIGVGQATKLMHFFTAQEKSYEFEIGFGKATDSLDLTGNLIDSTEQKVTKEQISSILPSFFGMQTQIPPIYSAIKIYGKRAYDLARKGEISPTEMPTRTVEIFVLKLLNFNEETQKANLFVKCSKGTYVRTLAADIAKKCSNLGHLTQLRRTSVGIFNETRTISLDKLEKIVHNDELFKYSLPIDIVLDDIPLHNMSENQMVRLKHGQIIEVNNNNASSKMVKCYFENQFFAIAELENENAQTTNMKAKRVFNF